MDNYHLNLIQNFFFSSHLTTIYHQKGTCYQGNSPKLCLRHFIKCVTLAIPYLSELWWSWTGVWVGKTYPREEYIYTGHKSQPNVYLYCLVIPIFLWNAKHTHLFDTHNYLMLLLTIFYLVYYCSVQMLVLDVWWNYS